MNKTKIIKVAKYCYGKTILGLSYIVPLRKILPPIPVYELLSLAPARTCRERYEKERRVYRLGHSLFYLGIPFPSKQTYLLYKGLAEKYHWPYIRDF